ncbi:diguanylate cyclase [Rhodoferax sp. 4810]|nr:diguanylate cyclase [Rhodoferax jenense]
MTELRPYAWLRAQAVGLALGWLLAGSAHAAEPVTALPSAAASAHLPGEVTFCVDPDWPPFEQIDAQGQHVGIAAALLKRVAQRSGLNLRLVPTANWDESLAASQAGRCQLMSFLNQSPKRDAWLLFTEPLLTDENVFITREEHPFIADPDTLAGQTLVLPKGTSVEERLRREFPQLQILLVDSEAQAFAAVNERRADLTLRSLIVAASTIKQGGWFNLKIAGQLPGYGNQLRIGVIKSQPALRERLNLAVLSITPTERQAVVDEHVRLNVVTALDTRPLWALGGVLLAVLLTSTFWIWRLRKLNLQLQKASLTDALTGLRNRHDFDTLYERELERSRRHGMAMSVVLLDIDFFKRINDELGHPVGDRVLQEVAGLLRQGARSIDHVIRWGGEEFLLLCPDTSAEQAKSLAERLVQTARQHDFGVGRAVTISAGVATLTPDDAPGNMFKQVDTALYQAKNTGRDKVVVCQQGECA